MIRYPITRRDLEALVKAEKSDWLDRAKERTEAFRAKGKFEEKASIWSEVKKVYMVLQDSKCAYCERQLESIEIGKVEQDVEHFRPKSNIREWKLPSPLKDKGIQVSEVPGEGRGYFLLPYNLFNYSATCKPCNSILKRDYFPIAGKYDLKGEDPKDLKKERPYLIHPVGKFDTDPEELIRFHGVSPQPVAKSGHRRHRALVTIEFFKLDNVETRKTLIHDRIRIILMMLPYLERLETAANPSERASAKRIVDRATSPHFPHTNCARSFLALFKKDPTEAKSIADKAEQLLGSVS